MNIKGEIIGIKEAKDRSKIFTLKDSSGLFKVIGKFDLYVKKGNIISFLNVEKKKRLLGTIYETSDKTLTFIEPEIFVTYEEMEFSNFCSLAPIFYTLFLIKKKNKKKELLFFKGIRTVNSNNRFSRIATRFSKELKGKFSYKQFIYDQKTGFLVKDALYFGKFPVVFSGDEKKGKILALSSGTLKYVVIDENSGTMQEKTMKIKDAQDIATKRNEIIKNLIYPIKEDVFKKEVKTKCPSECPVYRYCKEIDNKRDRLDIFIKSINPLVKRELKFRKIYLKTLTSGNNPIQGNTPLKLKSKDVLNGSYSYTLEILSNEAEIKPKEEGVITERPPLDRKTVVSTETVSFRSLKIISENEIITPELISPLPKRNLAAKGIFDFVYSNNSSMPYATEKKSVMDVYESKKFIKNDKVQNEAVNKIINMHGFLSLSGEHGTGKKYVLKKAISELVKYGKTFLIITQSRKKEIEHILKSEFDELIEQNDSIKIYSFEDNELYNEPSSFNYTVILLNSHTNKSLLESFMGKSENIIFITTPDSIPFEERIPESNKVKLTKEYRFGNHILHFLQPILSDKLDSIPDVEMTSLNPDKASIGFKQVIDPSKFVLYISIKGNTQGLNNKWNEAEAEFTVLAAKEFTKAGAKHSQIEIIVPYERQKAYIEYLLEKEKSGKDILVALPNESMEKDIVILSLTDTKKIGGSFADNSLLKIALTRGRSKLIIAGNRNIYKTSKLLSRII